MSKSDSEDAPSSIEVSVDSLSQASAQQSENGPETQPSLAPAPLPGREPEAAPSTDPATAPPTDPASARSTQPDASPPPSSDRPAVSERVLQPRESGGKRLGSRTLISGAADKPTVSPVGWMSLPRRADATFAIGIYVLCSLAFLLCASKNLLEQHTPYNHFAHLARAWLDGDLHLANGPPAYARNNDFALYRGEWYVTFPPFPALILLPFVALAGDVESVRDGQIFLWLAGLAPSFLFLALRRLVAAGLAERSRLECAVLALCFGLGSVYYFTAVQGTVWFAAHVVAADLGALYLLFSIEARRPLLAGLMIGLGLLTRAPLVFAVPLFAMEALRVCAGGGPATASPGLERAGNLQRRFDRVGTQLRQFWERLDRSRLLKSYVLFSLPIVLALLFTFWHNTARFGEPMESGYRYLTVAWKARMNKWGLFHYHYLARNLGVVLTSLPWLEPTREVPFRINLHGLALWVTTPVYFWLIWPRRRPAIHLALWLTVVCVALPTLFYQNTGWAQFGYRFSNDYAVFLFALIATGMRPLRILFALAALWGLTVNAFGAATFNRAGASAFYYSDRTQQRLYQKD